MSSSLRGPGDQAPAPLAPTAVNSASSAAENPKPGQMPDDPDERPRPRDLHDLFWSFSTLALQGFGGVLAVVQRELVEKKRWMSNEEFVEQWAVAQLLPGPNVVNLSIMIGERYFGLRGALTAVSGMLCLPIVLVLSLAIAYQHWSSVPAVAGALRGMGAVAAGLVAGTGLKLLPALRRHALGWPVAGLFVVLTFVAMATLRLPLAWVLASVGLLCCYLTWRKVAP